MKPDFVIALGRHCDMADQARFLVAEKIPFALEKPCGLSEREVAGIARAAQAAGAFAAVPLVFRNGDFVDLLREEAGNIQYMTYRFIAGFPQRYRAAGNDWMLDPALSGGGCTINLSPHFLDLALATMGPDVAVHQAVMSNAAWHERIEDYSCVTLARGADRCVIETGYLFPAPTSTFDMHYAIRTPARYIVAHDPDTVEIVETDGRRAKRRMLTTNVPHYRTFVFDALARVRAGKPPLVSLADYIPVARLADAAYTQEPDRSTGEPRSIFRKMVPRKGLEPPTPSLRMRLCSLNIRKIFCKPVSILGIELQWLSSSFANCSSAL